MKKLIVIFVLLTMIMNDLSAQYYKLQRIKPVSFQVGLNSGSYNGHLMYGFHIGGNFSEIFDISYFHVRDYKSREETWMDSRWYGLTMSLMLPVSDQMQVGPTARLSMFNEEKQRTFWGLEARWELGWNSKFAFFYGQGGSEGGGVRLIWNIY